jgi:hypothetical protein
MLPRLSGPGWIAAIGAAMLLVASVIVVAGQWKTIGPEARFAGLVGSLLAIYFAAEAGRRRIRATSTALAVLAACLTAPVGIAAAAALDAEWPICITIGGLAALLATELQSRRWSVGPLKAAVVVAVGLTVTGVAALSGSPVALLGAGAAALALASGATRRSVALASAVPLVPVLGLLADAGVGAGTLARIGATGTASWVAPVSSLIAGLVIAVTAHRRSSDALATASLATIAFGAVVGLVDAAPPAGVWLALPAAIVACLELASFARHHSLFGRWADAARTVASPALALVGVGLPVVVSLGTVVSDELGDGSLRAFVLPVCATAAATLVAVVAQRSPSATNTSTVAANGWRDGVLTVGAIGATVAIPAVFDLELSLVAALALGGWLLSTRLTAWRVWIPVTTVHVGWAIVAIGLAGVSPAWFSVVVLVSTAMMLAACASSTTASARFVGVPTTVFVSTALLAGQWNDALPWLAATLAVIAVATTGTAMCFERFGILDAFALSVGVAALAVSFGATPASVSLALTLVATQCWLYSIVADRVDGAGVSAAIAGAGLLSLWWTTGTNQLAIEWLAPHGIDGQDLALGAASLALILAGVAIRATIRPSTWLAYSPGFGTAVAWLLVSQDAPDGDWATLGALLVGVVAVGIGGARRLGAPLVLGTVALGGTLLISAGPRLAAAPTWAWIAVGGIGLLTVAALVERSERPLLPIGEHREVESLVESFCQEFE